MRTREVLGITPYVDGFEYGINENQFMASLYSKVNDRNQILASEFYQYIQKPKSEVHHKLIIVYGYSGCGKSTLVGRLLYDLRKDNNLTFKLDLAESVSGDYYYFQKQIHNAFGHKTLGKLLSLLKVSISKELSQKINGQKKEELANYKARLANYQSFFNECNDRNLKLFAKGLEKELNYNFNDENIYLFLEQEVNQYIEKGLDNTNEDKYLLGACKNALGFLLLLLRCEWKSRNSNVKYYFVIDSLEHFIGRDQIFDKDIENIISNILIPLVEQEDRLDVDRFPGEKTLNDIFKIIVSCRNSTLSMVSTNLDDDDYQDYYTVDVSDWYSAEDIILKRLKYFDTKIEDPEVIKLINKILGGDDNVLKERLLTMHNHNMRRLFSYLCDIINKQKNMIEQYETLTKMLSEQKTIADSIKYGLRTLIQGWLFFKIKETRFFYRIKVMMDNRDAPLGNGLARKILTYLEYKASSDNGYVGFHELLNCALINGGNVTENFCKEIKEVLSALSEADKSQNHWCQLIMIKFNDQEFNDLSLFNKIMNAQVEDRQKYAIKITPAGQYFLSFMSSFEYFSIRYNNNYRPLFDLRWLKIGNINNIIKLIEQTKEKAFICINQIFDKDCCFFKTANSVINFDLMYEMNGQLRKTEDGHLITHVESIIDNHISYLDAYRKFIIKYNMSEDLKRQLLIKILEVIELYCVKNEEMRSKMSPDGKTQYLRNGKIKECYYLKNCKKAKADLFNEDIKILKNMEG